MANDKEKDFVESELEKAELVEGDLEKVAGGKRRRLNPEKDLTEEEREKLKEFQRRVGVKR